MASRTRYRCQYCGVDEFRTTVASVWERKQMKCKKCGHGKFDEKKLVDNSDVYGYGSSMDVKLTLDWDYE